MTERDHLLFVIEKLTKRRKPMVIQTRGGISCVSRPEQLSLLEQLDDARAGGTMGGGGGRSLDGSRIPINAAAVTLWEEIQTTTAKWFRDAYGTPAPRDPASALRRWFLSVQDWRARGQATADDEEFFIGQVRTWADTIGAMFDPMVPLELTRQIFVPRVHQKTGEPIVDRHGEPRLRVETRPAFCPACENDVAYDPETGDQRFALIVEYRRSAGEDALRSAVATCRFCGETWLGEAGCKKLIAAIDEQEEVRSAAVEPA